ncbi:FAD dependent oxidoreductase [Arachidicoccus rhizosphaerae]|uniref:FAD dependent oxidoreductase n=1 Tax=Arachidicoccus rhizosphaerae TaxID=551991 RepID=A0A1H4AK79_9BACT|nr:FAD-dependent oxidoreductase [Arachidicoccus rhizosphaerae]SEA36336.1 FAD dependent oxidoreductase [Arachidicoccus rhizosphaerae]
MHNKKYNNRFCLLPKRIIYVLMTLVVHANFGRANGLEFRNVKEDFHLYSLLAASDTVAKYDIVVYGATPGGIMSAIAASKTGGESGFKVLLISPDAHIGGMTASGLGWTDIGNPAIIGGLAREFYHQIYKYYQKDASWKSGTLNSYRKKLYGIYKLKDSLMWTFEPHVAEKVFESMLSDAAVTVVKSVALDRRQKPDKQKGYNGQMSRLGSIRMDNGQVYKAKLFIDASYEGDLMALAGISFAVGREANANYKETINGVEKKLSIKNNLPRGISPYRMAGNPKSGLLHGIETSIKKMDGERDDLLQAYCYRMCLTNDSANRIRVKKPKGYQRDDFELLIRAAKLGEKRMWKVSPLPNSKIDANNDCGISMDAIGWNKGYLTASYKARLHIAKRHRYWTLGFIWTVQNDLDIPQDVRASFSRWGLPKDEFKDNGHFPYALYVREARRMVSDYVMSEKDVLAANAPHGIAMGAYTMDSHNTQRYISDKGDVQNEGDVQIAVPIPYPIPYDVIIPKMNESENILVPVCLSATHIAYGSIRMEPVFMALGEAAGIAATLALKNDLPVQNVPYDRLENALLKAGQVLSLPKGVN